jgi:hypothetical protein
VIAPAYVDGDGVEVTAILVATPDDIRAVKKYSEWHEGQVRVLTYPTADPVLFVGLGNDVALLGRQHRLGQYLVKGPAGDIEPWPAAMFEEKYSAVAA